MFSFFKLKDNKSFYAQKAHGITPTDELNKSGNGVILFCVSGKMDIVIDLKLHKISDGSHSIIMPNSFVKIEYASPDCQLYILEVGNSLFREICVHISPTFFMMIRTSPCIRIDEQRKKTTEAFLLSVIDLCNDENRYKNQIFRSLFNAYILFCFDYYQRFVAFDKINLESTRNSIFDKFINLVYKHCATQREVSFYSDKLCISTKYLSDICNAVTGVSAKKIIDNFVILEIKILLHDTNMNMQDIAHKMAFPDQSYMGRFFKRHEKISPGTFRKQVINEMGG